MSSRKEAADLFMRLQRKGLRLWAEDGGLKVAPLAELSDQDSDRIRWHRDDLLRLIAEREEFLRRVPEAALRGPYDHTLSIDQKAALKKGAKR